MSDGEYTRKDKDLNSIEVGTPSKGAIKIYFDSRTDCEENLTERINLALKGIQHAKAEMGA